MARRHRNLLTRLDSIGLNRYQIAEEDVQTVEKYLGIIQANLAGFSVWDELVHYGGEYGTSILIHEVVELRHLGLTEQGLRGETQRSLRQLLFQNLEAHIFALYEEHLYLQEAMNRLYSENFEVATLIKANRSDDRDLQLFLKGGIGLFLLEEERVATARRVLAELKVGGKR